MGAVRKLANGIAFNELEMVKELSEMLKDVLPLPDGPFVNKLDSYSWRSAIRFYLKLPTLPDQKSTRNVYAWGGEFGRAHIWYADSLSGSAHLRDIDKDYPEKIAQKLRKLLEVRRKWVTDFMAAFRQYEPEIKIAYGCDPTIPADIRSVIASAQVKDQTYDGTDHVQYPQLVWWWPKVHRSLSSRSPVFGVVYGFLLKNVLISPPEFIRKYLIYATNLCYPYPDKLESYFDLELKWPGARINELKKFCKISYKMDPIPIANILARLPLDDSSVLVSKVFDPDCGNHGDPDKWAFLWRPIDG